MAVSDAEGLYNTLVGVHAEMLQQWHQWWSVTRLFRSPFGTPRSQLPSAGAPEHKPKDRSQE